MKIEEFLKSLPNNIISGDNVQLPEYSFRRIFKFLDLNEKDIFYHLGCGDGKGIAIASEEFNVKKAVGVENNKENIQQAEKLLKKKNLKNIELLFEDIKTAKINDATVVLFWFTDNDIIETMMKKFESLQHGSRIITIWGPLPGCLPAKVDFPYIINTVPFKSADLKEQLLAIFDTKCIDFVTAWEYAERYTKAIGSLNSENDRFLTILQSLIIWINAKNLGIACGNEIPEPIKNYMGILKTFFGIEVEHLLK
ncbi:MAG: methyltransferase domain-containing protein [Candidatus Nitrosopelagicus sp.]|nr:methyltransferase domain-containing protein [Candidatus Nitrosopelagicus sp.]NWJ90562.1 methyltransferase domain-containing protein [Marine Group I thaumarchaeote]PXF27190.1 MAG: SAM-dependent methyltransferase [Nitrososphaerota archaeon]HIA09839.1 methyltransferase domain-containing protein [Candidatus Nitrosopelagicus sp.]HIA96673.1 methyltransferase domain-containing protein [Candidatus Nitrosopelagicus sp.]